MYETYQEAINALSELTKNGPATEAQLDDFISHVSRHSSGNTTILYSGADADVLAAIDKNTDARMIGKTLSAKILESSEFKIAKAHSMGLEDASTIDVRDPPSPLNKAFNDIGGEWDTLSRRFVSETHGQVYGLTGVAPPDRIWAKTEIFEALKRAEVPMIEGIPRTVLTQVRDDLVTTGKYATPDEATFAVRAKVSIQADDNLRNSMVGVDEKGVVKWIDTERLTNGALRNLPKPPELTYTLYAEHFDRKHAASLASDNPKIVQRAIETQTIRNANPQVVSESIESLRTLPENHARKMAIEMMEHKGSTKELYAADAPANAITDTHLRDPLVHKIGSLNRSDLATLNDELINRYKYTPTQAMEAVNARVTLNSAVEDFKAGKGLNTSDEVLRSQAIVRQTTTVMSDSVANAAQVETMNRQFTAYNSAINKALPEVVQTNFAAIDKPATQSIKLNTQSTIDLTPTERKTTNPLNGYTQQFNQITATEDAFAQKAHTAKQAEQASKRIERQHLSNEPIKSIQLEADIKNGIKAEAQIAKALSQTEHLAAGLESGLSKVAGKALVGVGLVDAGITIRHDVKEAVRTANNNQEEWTKGTAALSKGVMQESGVDLAISAVDAASQLNIVSTARRMVQNQTLDPFKGIGDEVQKNAQAREEAYTKFGETTGNSLYNTFSKEGGARAEAEKLTQALPNITDPEGRRNAEILRDAFAQTAQEEHLKNQNRIAGVHGVMNSYDDFIAKNPRYTDISKDNAVDEANKLTGNGMAAGQAVSAGYNNLKQQLDIENAERLAKLSEADRQATLKVMERNPSASVRTASELVELANNRGMTTMGGAPIGENMYKAALAKMEEANQKADPTYGKDANDIRLQQQIEQAKAAEQAHQQLLKAVEKLDLDSKISYYQAKAVEQRKDPNHFAHPHDAASNVVHLQYQKKRQMEAQGHTNYRVYGKEAQHNQSNGVQHRPAPKPAELGMGASGQKVTNLQNVLKSLGADIVVDGKFGSTTRDAVKEFQREHNLKVDGKIGLNDAKVIGQAVQAKDAQQAITTLAQLNQRGMHLTDNKDGNNTSSSNNDNSAAIQTLQEAKPKTYNLKQGAQGEPVHQIQLALNQLGHNVPMDGVFDKTTQDAVKAFQKEYGLQPDGAMNPKDTWQLAQAVDNHQRVQAQLAEQKQSISATQSITTPPVNQPDVNTPAAPAVSPEQSKQVEQMVSVLSANPAFAALAPDVQMTMAAQMMAAAQAVNLQPQVQPQVQTVTAQVQDTPEPITQTAVPTVAQAEPQPVVVTPVQSSPAYVAPAMTSPAVATAEVEQPARQVNTVSPSTQPIVLSPRIAKLHEQITHHLTQGEFGNQLAHLSEKDQQAAIALATHEATRNLARSVDYVQINKDGDVMMGFDGNKGFSAEMNLKQVQNNEANQVLAASMDLQQTQAQNLAMRQEQSRNQGGPTITM